MKTKTRKTLQRPYKFVRNKENKRDNNNRKDMMSELPEEILLRQRPYKFLLRPRKFIWLPCKLILNKKRHKRDHSYKRTDTTISDLPEDILFRIVSLLPLKDAIGTSILSRRWRKIWTFIPNLNFDEDENLLRWWSDDDYFEKLESERSKIIKRVNTVLNQHVGDINRFGIYFDLNRDSTPHIDNWIKFAMENRVQILELMLYDYGTSRISEFGKYYILQQELVFGDGVDYVNKGFKSLKVLHLRSVKVTGEVIELFLSKCQSLERLQVHDSSKVVNLKVAGPSLALKHLELYRCKRLKSIEIYYAENLALFHLDCDGFDESPLKVVIRNVPMLVDVYISRLWRPDYPDCALTTMLSSCVSQLQILQLDIDGQPYVENRVYPMLKNVKQLSLILSQADQFNLVKIIPFLKAAPYLERLVLKSFTTRPLKGELKKPTECPRNYYLKEVEMWGYSGLANDVELITYFIENAVSLKKVIINPFIYRCYSWRQPRTTKIIEEEKLARDHAMKHVKEKVPPSLEFICL